MSPLGSVRFRNLSVRLHAPDERTDDDRRGRCARRGGRARPVGQSCLAGATREPFTGRCGRELGARTKPTDRRGGRVRRGQQESGPDHLRGPEEPECALFASSCSVSHEVRDVVPAPSHHPRTRRDCIDPVHGHALARGKPPDSQSQVYDAGGAVIQDSSGERRLGAEVFATSVAVLHVHTRRKRRLGYECCRRVAPSSHRRDRRWVGRMARGAGTEHGHPDHDQSQPAHDLIVALSVALGPQSRSAWSVGRKARPACPSRTIGRSESWPGCEAVGGVGNGYAVIADRGSHEAHRWDVAPGW